MYKYATQGSTFAQYYPPVNGLLMGESYHIIPGTTATSGISLTEDTALKPALIGHCLAANHLGPYSQEGVWQIAGTHNSGEASAIFEVDLNGFVSGNALAFTWSNEFRPLSWGLVNVVGASSTELDRMELLHVRRRLPSLPTHRQLQVHHQRTRLRTSNLVSLGLTRPDRHRPERLPGTDQHTRPRIQHNRTSRLLSASRKPIPTQTQTQIESGTERARRAPPNLPFP